MNQESSIRRLIARRAERVARVARLLGILAIGTVGVGAWASPALAGECPNEALRAENSSLGLSECRAYELVSNPFKEGFAPFVQAYTDDGVLSYRSAGNFAENNLGGAGNEYRTTRTAGGWRTEATAPSGTIFGGASAAGSPVALSADLRTSVWMLRRAGESTNVEDPYLCAPNGTCTRIGPGVNPASLQPGVPGTTGTGIRPLIEPGYFSADLSHVLLAIESSQQDFPGDETVAGRSLYEYVGTGNERPELVGVDNLGHQISQVGTCPSGISSDGRVVFFTPECGGADGQVWARINGTTSIQASASQCTRTSGDPGGVCNAAAQGEFAGAAIDGSRVYLTTTQQLLNGDTDQTDDLYACDIPPGTPAPVGTANPCASLTEVSGSATGAEVENIVDVSEDGSRVYFVAKGVLAGNIGTNDATAVAGDNNLYVSQLDAAHPSGQTTFVAKLDSDDITGAQSTAEGRYLVFTTANQLLPSDTDEAQDVYRYDADTHALLRLSTDTSGTGGNEPGLNATTSVQGPLARRRRTIMTSNGATVVFLTSEALSPADTNGQLDVYGWHDGQVSLISGGRPYPENPSVPFVWISSSGTDIYFNTSARLTPNDGDGNNDIYDARVDGGFSFAQPQPCSGETCQPPFAPAPQSLAASGTGAFSAADNPPSSVTTPAPKPPPKPLTRAQKLSRALKACKSKHSKKKRSACERKARATYRKGK